ncbi:MULTISPECIES: MDR family MFS transporter [Paenarthrobacter]|uniref:MFS transporter n=1 Tax=Paenarthrobacter ureafaciens TaxID=37931 RepID=A0AAX3EKZ1_PAEUR|nr:MULTISPECIES: MDR family MFS transporter [Paenarthrobacter]NKR12547.1 MFS transporter [Arthrobacter sp. M5]NKR17078.1 MFS transporter [Arthrobacter sp. M6]OEH61210.1 MFS transporter [Arthrobacter sp. D4]OEH61701.1 MFS transporter [Arthrobacter sp. D2]MDO5863684.1 MFS transporter [Paenarthrobacter sp. SD-2]
MAKPSTQAPGAGQASASGAAAPMTHRQIMEALTGLLAAFFTAILSSTIVANALPTIMSELHGTQTDFAWVITAALLANAATTPIWGKLADLFDKKLLVQLSIIIFVAGSVMAGLSETIPLLLTARVIQGVAMGGLTALAQAIIGSMIPPRDRGKYSGYMGAVMAVGTAGGPLLGGFIVDSPLGWRWTFFVCVPLAVVALILLQITLKIQHIKRPAKIDWLGSILLTSGVSLLLIWVSFAGDPEYYDWVSWQSALMVGGGVVLLALLVFVEGKVQQPIIPLKIISERTTALAILASVSVGIAMFGSSTFLGQYFQVARGATPTEAGLLTLPMIAGNLIGSVASGILISRFGKWKRFLIAGSVLLIGGLAFAGTMDHTTELWLVAIYTAVFGLGLGMLMQNLVLAVQNTVRATDIGTASASVAFFRSVGGAIGVSVLGAIMSNHVKDLAAEGLAAAGIPVQGDSSGASLDLADMPAPIADIMRAAYGDATAQIFLISAVISVVALIAVLLIKERPLRRTVDAAPEKELIATASGDAGMSLDSASFDAVKPDDGTRLRSSGAGNAVGHGRSGKPMGERSAEDLDLEFARILTQERPNSQASNTDAKPADVKELQEQLSRTQYVLAEQQLQLSRANVELQARLREQQSLAEQQARTADELKALRRELKRERRQQERTALMLLQGVESRPDHGKHAG